MLIGLYLPRLRHRHQRVKVLGLGAHVVQEAGGERFRKL